MSTTNNDGMLNLEGIKDDENENEDKDKDEGEGEE